MKKGACGSARVPARADWAGARADQRALVGLPTPACRDIPADGGTTEIFGPASYEAPGRGRRDVPSEGGATLAGDYLEKYGADAWWQIRAGRKSTQPVVYGTDYEAMRNAERYLYAYGQIAEGSHARGPVLALTTGDKTLKFWPNVGEN